MFINLPSYYSETKFKGASKNNIIKHLVLEEQMIEVFLDRRDRNKLHLKDNTGKSYLLTTDKNITSEIEFILLVKPFTDEIIRNNNIEIVKWLKHPLIKDYTPQEIINSWEGAFNYKKEDLNNNISGLRTPQIGAIHSLLGHLSNANDIANIILPTGTGKTETMLSTLIANKCEKVLVTVPSDPLRTQLANKFFNLGWLKKNDVNGKCIVNKDALYPIVGVINSGFNSIEELTEFISKCNVVVSTMDLLAGRTDDVKDRISKMFSHLFVDEAHHSKATNWNNFINYFDKAKVIQFTATPYRNDGQMLDGKMVYNFSLKNAQEQGYFKEIEFIPVREYDTDDADAKIAEFAVNRLRNDLSQGFDHILMARCNTKDRADSIFSKYYEKYTDLNPIIIYSNIEGLRGVKEDIINRNHKIIVCVDMLGEGFDLPELKIAAFHDVRKSLPITLQFAGRFTRTNKDRNLGNACFIANMHQPNMDEVLSLLYTRESNWNTILPHLSLQATEEQVDLKEFMEGFDDLENFIIPLQEIRPAFSCMVYKNTTSSWNPNNFSEGIPGYDNYDYKFYDINRKKRVIIVLLGNKKPVEWSRSQDVYNIEWNIYVIFWETKNNLLFINSSDKSGVFKNLATSILDENAVLISDKDVFRALSEIDRLKVFNLGLRKGLGKDITFQSYYGRGVAEGLSLSEEKSGISNNLFGSGFENGNVTSIGVSRKGRIWSYSRGTINKFVEWCEAVGNKISNQNIDGDEILLKNTIKPQKVAKLPDAVAINVDWNPDIYRLENRINFEINGISTFDLSNTELNVVIDESAQKLQFIFHTDSKDILFEIKLSQKEYGENVEYLCEVEKLTDNISAKAIVGVKEYQLEDFFKEYPPMVWYHNGNYLVGNDFVALREDIFDYPKEDLIDWDWLDTELGSESEGFDELKEKSIQHFCIKKFLREDWDIVFNDDNSGEIADILLIKDDKQHILIQMYHLKYASSSKISNEIGNLYEVCGQAQKSLIWRHKDRNEHFFERILKREKKKNKQGFSRIRKGTIENIEYLLGLSKIKPLKFEIFIVQPSISKEKVSTPILGLLGVTANHLKKEGGIDLQVITNK